MFDFFRRRKSESAGFSHNAPGFRMIVEDVFSISGCGTVVTGTVEYGTLCVKDLISIRGAHGCLPARVDGLESCCQSVKTVRAGDRAGVLLRKVQHTQVAQGDRLEKD